MGRALSVCAIALLCAAVAPVSAGAVRDALIGEHRAAGERVESQKSERAGGSSDETSEDERKRRRDDAKKLYKLGVQFGTDGRYVEAIDAFSRSVSLDSSNPDAHFGLGHAYSDIGRWPEAAEALKRAVRLNPKDAEAYHRLGTAYFKSGRYEESILAFKEALLLKPKWADARYNIANAFFNMGRYEPAVVNYTDVLHFKPNFADVHNDLGVAHSELGRHAQAAASFKRAINYNSEDAYPHNNLGLLYFHLGRRQEAVRHLKEALRLAPGDAGIRDNFNLVSAGNGMAATGERVAASGADQARGAQAPAISTTRWRGRSSVVRIGELKELGPTEQVAVVSATILSPQPAATAPPQPAPQVSPQSAAPRRISPQVVQQTRRPAASAAPPSIGSVLAARMDTAPATLNTLTNASINLDAAPPAILKREAEPFAAPSPASSSLSSASSAVALTDIYRVGVGDVLDVRLLDAPTSASTLYTVLAGGLLEYPLAGDPVVVTGMTTDEIAARISEQLRQRAVHENPRVIASVREYASHAVIVSGLVAEPGSKILRREAIPLYVVIADAQPRPEAGRVTVASHATGRNTELDLSDTLALNTLVRPGDVITVAGRAPQFYFIGGQVNEPGQKDFHAGLTLTQAILASGGVLHSSGGSARAFGAVLSAGAVSSAPKSIVRITRQNTDGHLATIEYNLRDIVAGQTPDPPVRPGDRIEVGK